MLSLFRKAALNAWNKVREPGEQLEAYTRIEQGPTEQFQDFLQRLTRAVELQVTDPETRQSIIYTISYENANPICKRILLPLKIRSAPLEEWVLYAANIDYNVQDTGAWVGEAISKGLKRHQEIKRTRDEDVGAWQGQAPYR
ncbi:hypothetical protein ACQP3L_27800, partial [Escherichia coli]